MSSDQSPVDLGAQFERIHSDEAVRILTGQMLSPESLAASHYLATAYLARRSEDLAKLMRDMKWEADGPFKLRAKVYGNWIVHELKACQLKPVPCWGMFVWGVDESSKNPKPVFFDSFECFSAFVLAKWW